jgi:hypothetical protein
LIFEQAWWVRGLSACPGVAMLDDGALTFVPCERPRHLGVELAWGMAGFVQVGRSRSKIDPVGLIATLRTCTPAQRDEIVQQLAGIAWTPAVATLRERTIPLRRSRRRLWFLAGKESVRLARAFTVPEVETLRPVLAAWPASA